MTADEIIAEIVNAFASCGHLDYGEHINMQEHMLQTAYLAEKNGENDAVVVAALLHDYGHLVCKLPNSTFHDGQDNFHEAVGAEALSAWFGPEIVEPVRLHVAAKRYLCATDPDYRDKLSEASVLTMSVQGGPMDDQEAREFERLPGHESAIRIRRYDDMGKLEKTRRPNLDHYLPKIRACLKSV